LKKLKIDETPRVLAELQGQRLERGHQDLKLGQVQGMERMLSS